MVESCLSYPRIDSRSSLSFVDPLDWLSHQTHYPKVYWKNKKTGEELAAAGNVFSLDHVPSFDSDFFDEIRFFGATSFSNHFKTCFWEQFPKQIFFVPLFELYQHKKNTILTTYSSHSDRTFFQAPNPSSFNAKALTRKDNPSFDRWEKQILRCLKLIASNRASKVILARQTTFHFEDPIDPFQLVRSLRLDQDETTIFAFQFSEDSAFIGASPEKLYVRKGPHITSEAVAGTRPRGKTSQEDLELQQDLLSNAKELAEFQIVKQFILDRLAPLCESCLYSKPDQILKTSTVQHIFNQCSGILKKSIHDAQILEALHPTPAIAGFPRGSAIDFIESTEQFDRGWYAAPIGWISPREADMTVAIRSGLVADNKLHLFAGTGIVEQSNPEKEWKELECKISQFTKFFYN